MPTFTDHIAKVLRGEPTIDDRQRESLWDLAYQSKDVGELAARLHPMELHPMLKLDLLKAKSKPAVEYDNLDRAMQAVERVSTLDPRARELAEKHPSVLKALMENLRSSMEE